MSSIEGSESLPPGWAKATLAELCDINPKHAGDLPDTVPVSFVPMAAVSEQTGEITEAIDRPYGEVRKGYTHFADGDVLWAKITPCMENGKAAIARDLTNGIGCGTTEFFVLRSRGAILPEYLHHFMRQESYRQSARHTMQSGVGQARVPREFVERTLLPLPPLAEQHRIVAKLDEMLASSRAARATLNAVPALTRSLMTSVMELALRGELSSEWRELDADHPSANEELAAFAALHEGHARRKVRLWGSGRTAGDAAQLPPLPPTWVWARVSQLGTPGEVVQIGPMSMRSSEFVDNGRLVLNVGCIRDGWVDTSKANHLPQDLARDFERYALRTADVIFTRSGSVGRCALLPNDADGALMTFHLLRVRVDPRVCLPAYLLLALRGSAAVARQVQGAAIGATRAGFNTRLLEDLWIPLAPTAEQAVILDVVEQRVTSVQRQQNLTEVAQLDLSRLNEALLAKAFRGELVLQSPSDEPASALLSRIQAERAETPARRSRRRTARA